MPTSVAIFTALIIIVRGVQTCCYTRGGQRNLYGVVSLLLPLRVELRVWGLQGQCFYPLVGSSVRAIYVLNG